MSPEEIARPNLTDIERHVAWLYATALRLLRDSPVQPGRRQRLVQQVLRESEALRSLVGRLRVLDLDPDLALDVAMIQGRALDLWRIRLKEWRTDPQYADLVSAGTELLVLAGVLQDALASPSAGEDDESSTTLRPVPRSIQ
jgi:hypothetical protein